MRVAPEAPATMKMTTTMKRVCCRTDAPAVTRRTSAGRSGETRGPIGKINKTDVRDAGRNGRSCPCVLRVVTCARSIFGRVRFVRAAGRAAVVVIVVDRLAGPGKGHDAQPTVR